MRKKDLLLCFVFSFIYNCICAQKEASNWYFGNYAGITFKNGSPAALPNSPLFTFEGVASVSDSVGKILFYTDGIKVYNSQNLVMPNGNGLLGNSSSSQSAIIVKKPGSQTLYYVFTIDCIENAGRKGLNYSIVDMSLNGGLGDITTKNILLRNNVLEKLTVARHKNNHDFWILITDLTDRDIFAYYVSCNGVDNIPVKSNVGPINGNNFGYLKASRQNNKLAVALSSDNNFEVFDFDNTTGKASNKKDIQGTSSTFGEPYGVEFSPDGNLLYGTTITSPKLFQFNLNAGSGVNIYNSRILLATHGTIYTLNYYYYGALQIGPDGKIYSANNGDVSLGVINNPNTLGTTCNYVNNGVSLNGKQCFLGLPNFLTDYAFPVPRDTVYVSICKKSNYTLPDGSIVNTPGIYITHLSTATTCDSVIVTNLTITPPSTSSIKASFCQGSFYQLPSGKKITVAGIYNDTLLTALGCDSIIIANLSIISPSFSSITQSICNGQSYLGHSTAGTYADTLIAANGCDSIRTLILTIKPISSSLIDTAICSGQTYSGYGISGTYVDTLVAVNGCDSFRTVHLLVKAKSFSTIDTSICAGQTYLGHGASGTYIDTLLATNRCDSIRTLHLSIKAKSFSTTNIAICSGQTYMGHNVSGTYIDTLVAANGCDSIHALNLTVSSKINTTVDTTVCHGKSYMGYSVTGNYTDMFLTASGCDSVRTLKLTVLTETIPNLGIQKNICTGDSIILYPGSFNTYLWQDGSTESTLTVKHAGTYSVTVTNNCDTLKDAIVITEETCNFSFPSAFTPNGDGKNDTFKILKAFNLGNYNLIIYNRLGQKVFQTTDYNKGWDGRLNGELQPTGTYVYYCTFNDQDKKGYQFIKTVVLIR